MTACSDAVAVPRGHESQMDTASVSSGFALWTHMVGAASCHLGGHVNAASLQKPAGSPPVAAAPAAPQGSAPSGITPVSGQGFVPAAGAAQGAPAPQGAPGGAQGAQGAQQAPTAEQVLQSLVQVLGAEYGDPIVGADGTIYMEKKRPNVANGAISLSYLVVGKLDKATGKLTPSPEVLKIVQEKAKASEGGSSRVLVKVGDQMIWQTFSKDENGKPVVSEMKPATEQEIAAHQQEQAQAQAKQAAQAKLQNRGDWQQKVGVVAQHMGLFGSAGQLVAGLGSGPNPYTGRPGAGWISGWILAQRLNGKAEGKLLPKWMQSGPVATALEWGIQAYGALDMGNDIRILRDFLGNKPPLPPINPNAVQQLIAKGQHPAMAGAMAGLGKELRDGTLQMVDGTANAAVLNTKLGAVQLVPKADLHKAFLATDPVQSAGLNARAGVDAGITKGLGLLKGLIQPAMMGATALGLVSSTISVKNIIDTKGKGALVDTQQGRGAVLGAVTSAAFLGMYALPMILPGLGIAAPAIAAAASAINIAQNVLGGVQLVNSYGLFGGENGKAGFLDNDAVRAAFLIPPLTPIGAFAFWMKNKKKKQAEEAARLEAAQKLAVEKIQQQREMAKLQLQSTGQIAGATQGPDGSLVVSTGVPNDPARMLAMLNGGAGGAPTGAAAAPAPGGAPAAAPAPSAGERSALEQQRQQLTMVARPMR